MAHSLAVPLPATDLKYWQTFIGMWTFSMYHDYRMQLRATRREQALRQSSGS